MTPEISKIETAIKPTKVASIPILDPNNHKSSAKTNTQAMIFSAGVIFPISSSFLLAHALALGVSLTSGG